MISLSKQVVFLIDTENTGTQCLRYLPQISSKDLVILFYTSFSELTTKQTDFYIENFSNYHNVKLRRCIHGKDALDNQLVIELIFLFHENPDRHFIIVSDDRGFDQIIEFLRIKGIYNCIRLGVNAGHQRTDNKIKKGKNLSISDKNALKEKKCKKTVKKAYIFVL